MFPILHRPLEHILCIDLCPDGQFILRDVRKLSIRPEIVDNISKDIPFCTEFHPDGLSGEHIDMLRHVSGKVEPFVPVQFCRRLARGIKKPDIPDPVDAVVRQIVIFVIIADEIIAPVRCSHLIGVHNVFPDAAVLPASGMELLVHIIAAILECHLTSLRDCFIQYVDCVEQLRIGRLSLWQSADMLDLRPEIDIGQPLKFADQLPALAVGDVLGKQRLSISSRSSLSSNSCSMYQSV